MSRAALIRDGVVENIIIAGPGFDPGEGSTVVPIGDEPVEIGATYDGKTFSAPAPAPAPVPQSVTPRQMRRALNAMGLRDTIEQYVSTLHRDAQDDWEYGLTVERDNEIIETGRRLLGMSIEQVDDLFRLAASQ